MTEKTQQDQQICGDCEHYGPEGDHVPGCTEPHAVCAKGDILINGYVAQNAFERTDKACGAFELKALQVVYQQSAQ
jgi:hypothetical protein